MNHYLIGCSLAVIPAVIWLGYWAMGPHYVPGNLHKEKIEVARQNPLSYMIDVGDDVQIYQEVINEDGKGTPIFYIHGGPGRAWGEKEGWKETIPEGRKAHFYHQRGCGKSTKPLTSLPAENYFPANSKLIIEKVGFHHDILDLEKLRIAFNYNKISLVGHSWGGFIAAMYAAEFPDRVESLVLSAPAAILVSPTTPEKDLLKVMKTKLLEQGKTDLATKYDDYVKRLLDFGAIATHTDESLQELNDGMGEFYLGALNIDMKVLEKDTHDVGAGWAVTGSYVSLGMHHNYTPILKNIKCKTLWIEYEKDIVHEDLYETIPNVIKKDISDVTHFPHVENPTALVDAIKPFL